MGYGTLTSQSKDQLARRIRNTAKVTANVVMTSHVKQQMRTRKVTASMVYECLRNGQITRVPEENAEKGTLECRMERYCAGCQCTVIVALDEDYPDLVCVTVWV
jgi:citrate lyase gamma subunit